MEESWILAHELHYEFLPVSKNLNTENHINMKQDLFDKRVRPFPLLHIIRSIHRTLKRRYYHQRLRQFNT
jgi:hypothetical protein